LSGTPLAVGLPAQFGYAIPHGRVVTTRYSNWETYGKVQDAVATDAELLLQQMEIAEMMGRNIAVGIDL